MATDSGLKTWDKVVLVPVAQLVPTDWNANEMSEENMAVLIEDIDKGQFDEPLQVVPQEEEKDKYLVLGGEHRMRALIALGIPTAPCIIREDLIGLSRAQLIIWSQRRNNVRGRLNAQKYAEVERELIEQHQMTVEAARRQMLIKGDLLNALRKSKSVRENEEDGEDEKDKSPGEGKDRESSGANREKLLAALRTVEQDVLLQCGDTIEHNYLFFNQGERMHLLLHMDKKLLTLVQRMVDACKGESASVGEFLTSAITSTISDWEGE